MSRYNPFEWSVIAGRDALQASPDWTTIWAHLGLLAALVVVMMARDARIPGLPAVAVSARV